MPSKAVAAARPVGPSSRKKHSDGREVAPCARRFGMWAACAGQEQRGAWGWGQRHEGGVEWAGRNGVPNRLGSPLCAEEDAVWMRRKGGVSGQSEADC